MTPNAVCPRCYTSGPHHLEPRRDPAGKPYYLAICSTPDCGHERGFYTDSQSEAQKRLLSGAAPDVPEEVLRRKGANDQGVP
jgi:hypothetical protein